MRDEGQPENGLSEQVRSVLGPGQRQHLRVGAWEEDGDHLVHAQRTTTRGAEWIVETRWSTTGPRLEPLEVTIRSADGRPVRADLIRAIPLGTMQREARIEAATISARWTMAIAEAPAMRGLFAAVERPSTASANGPQRGTALTAEDLDEVAAVYREAWRNGWPVTEAVANGFHVSRSTASKRIMKARAAGLLDNLDDGGTR